MQNFTSIYFMWNTHGGDAKKTMQNPVQLAPTCGKIPNDQTTLRIPLTGIAWCEEPDREPGFVCLPWEKLKWIRGEIPVKETWCLRSLVPAAHVNPF